MLANKDFISIKLFFFVSHTFFIRYGLRMSSCLQQASALFLPMSFSDRKNCVARSAKETFTVSWIVTDFTPASTTFFPEWPVQLSWNSKVTTYMKITGNTQNKKNIKHTPISTPSPPIPTILKKTKLENHFLKQKGSETGN